MKNLKALSGLLCLASALHVGAAHSFYATYDDGCASTNIPEGSVLSGTSVAVDWPDVQESTRYYFRFYDPLSKSKWGPNTTYTSNAYVTGLPDDGRRLLMYCYNYIGGWQSSIWEVYAFDKANEETSGGGENTGISADAQVAIVETNEAVETLLKIVAAIGSLSLLFMGFNSGMHR